MEAGEGVRAALAVVSRVVKPVLRFGLFGDLGGVNKPTEVLSSLSTANGKKLGMSLFVKQKLKSG